ncbi:hypothetical protein Syun_001982 [Stephania yunnanensis]|uniref:Uncharacterized protein n=1 Tax=Stephania yunnanensis TaxID=152371 RepID=A0AAP0LEM5_9MAGN
MKTTARVAGEPRSSLVSHLGFGLPPPCLFFTALGPSSISRPVVQSASLAVLIRLVEIVSRVLWFCVELAMVDAEQQCKLRKNASHDHVYNQVQGSPKLTIDGSPKQFLLDHSGVNNGIRVFTPRLLSFTYRNHHAQCIHLEDVSSVVLASISLEFDWDVNHIVCGQRVSNSLEGLLNVKVLTSSSATFVLLSAASGLLGRLPALPKLVQLYVSIVLGKDHFRALTCFVHNSPNLEFFSVNIPHRQFYASFPAGTELLTDTAKLYKAALGNYFEIDYWGPIEYSIMAKHFERQGKPAYGYHAVFIFNLSSDCECILCVNVVSRLSLSQRHHVSRDCSLHWSVTSVCTRRVSACKPSTNLPPARPPASPPATTVSKFGSPLDTIHVAAVHELIRYGRHLSPSSTAAATAANQIRRLHIFDVTALPLLLCALPILVSATRPLVSSVRPATCKSSLPLRRYSNQLVAATLPAAATPIETSIWPSARLPASPSARPHLSLAASLACVRYFSLYVSILAVYLLLNGCLPSSLLPSVGLAYTPSTPSYLSFYLVLLMLSPALSGS